MGSNTRDRDRRIERALRAGIAFVWLATALSVAHPDYRDIGAAYLAQNVRVIGNKGRPNDRGTKNAITPVMNGTRKRISTMDKRLFF